MLFHISSLVLEYILTYILTYIHIYIYIYIYMLNHTYVIYQRIKESARRLRTLRRQVIKTIGNSYHLL